MSTDERRVVSAEGLDYTLLRPLDGDGPDRDRIAYPCTCGATIVVEAGAPPGRGFYWRATHGDGEALLRIDGGSDAHLLWIIGLADPIGDWVRAVHRHEGKG